MARLKVMTDDLNKETYFYDTKVDISYRRTSGGMCWPSKEGLEGCVVVLGEKRLGPMIYGEDRHDIFILEEFTSVDSGKLIDKMCELQSEYRVTRWAVPSTDPRGYLLYDKCDQQRRRKERDILRYGDPVGWCGGERELLLMPFYKELVARRTRDEKTLFFGEDSACAQEIGGMDFGALRHKATDYPCAAALFFALSEIDCNSYRGKKIEIPQPSDTLGGY